MTRKRKFQGNGYVSAKKLKPIPTRTKNLFIDNSVYTIEITLFDKETKDEIKRLLTFLHGNEKLFEEQIFLTSKQFDKKRRQISFEDFIRSRRLTSANKQLFQSLLTKIGTLLHTHLSKNYPGYVLSKGNILMSLPNGNTQAWHTDFG